MDRFDDLLEEREDLKDIEKILKEPAVPFEAVLEELDIKDEV